MANAVYNFANLNGQTIVFDPATDTLAFDSIFSAADLRLTQGTGTGVNATVGITIGGNTVILKGITIDMLRASALSFANGSVALIGDQAAGTSNDGSGNIINGGSGNDYLSGLAGNDTINAGQGNDMILTGTGTDSVNGGEGNDTIVADGSLVAGSRFDGGTGTDTLRLDGNYSGGVTFAAGTVSNIERIELAGDNNPLTNRTYKFTTHDSTVADGATLTFDGSSLDATEAMNIDGSAETTGSFQLLGGAASDTLKGGAGSDTIVGGAGNDFIIGGQGADMLTGGTGDDIFSFARGTSRSDSSPTTIDRITDFEGAGVIGGDKIDLPVPTGGTPLAFAGYKSFSLGGGEQVSNAGDGFADVIYDQVNGQTRIAVDVNDDGQITEVDQVIVLDGIQNLQAEDFNDNFSAIRGTNNADTILGSGGAEAIFAQGGNDMVDGRGGNDTINGGEGNDTLDGGDGNDTLNGDVGDDLLRGNEGNDTLNGGDGNDTLKGEAGADGLNGGIGTDLLEGGIGNDNLDGGAGNDTLFGGLDNDTLKGGADDDQLFGDAGNDTLDGGSGNDSLSGGADNDSLTGGLGNDTLHGDAGNDVLNNDDSDSAQDMVFGDEGNDTLYGGTGRDILTGGTGADRFVLTSASSSAANPNRVTDLNLAEGDVLQLTISGSSPKPLAYYGYKEFFFDGTFGNSGVQFPLAGDGLADAIYDYDVSTNTTRVAVDVNDDGVFSTGDLVVYLTGQHTLSFTDFRDTFQVIRGGAGDDVMPGTTANDTYYGMGGNDTITGIDGNDTLFGGDGNDNVDGGVGADSLYGDAGDDYLFGGTGVFADNLRGGTGNDTLDGGEGDDTLNGEEGADSIIGGLGNDGLNGGSGNDTLLGGDGNDNISGNDNDDQLDGGIGNDSLYGGDGNDLLNGGDNNDYLYGQDGNDTINAGDGKDSVDGGTGADLIDLGVGDDTIDGVGAGDTVTGGAGADQFTLYTNYLASTLANAARVTDFTQGTDKLSITYSGGSAKTFVFNAGDQHLGTLSTAAGSQTVLGNGGDGLNDVLYSKSADGLTTSLIVDVNDDGKLDASDIVVNFNGSVDFTTADFLSSTFTVQRGTDNADTIVGTTGNDTIYGVGGNDSLVGLEGNDSLLGQLGDDTLDGGAGNDTLDGGAGNDVILGGTGNFADTIHGGLGDDSIDGGDGNDNLNGNDGADSIFGGLGDDGLNGNAGNDTLLGGDGNDNISGNDDDDQLDGGIGNDTLYGGDGNDLLQGGDGNDTLYGQNGNDTINGGDLKDFVDGGAGADLIDLGTGDDTIDGVGAGDTVTGGAGNDQFTIYTNYVASTLAAQGRITDFAKGADKILLTYSGGSAKTFVFNSGNSNLGVLSTTAGSQTILGNGADGLNDVLYTKSADGLTTTLIIDVNDDGKLDTNDIVVAFNGSIDFTAADFTASTFTVQRGTEGADTITGTTGNDTIYGVGGNDSLVGLDGNDSLFGQNGDDTLDGGAGSDTLDGGDGNDVIFGGTGNFADTLYGGTGNDNMDGGDGNDYLIGNDGADSLVGGLGDDNLNGSNGKDTLVGGEGNDNLSGNDDDDQLDGGIGNDTLYGGNGNDALVGGDGNDAFYGQEGNDTINGGDGKDSVDGGNGADLINLGAGDDTIDGVGAGDTITGGAGADLFTVYTNYLPSLLGNQARITDFEQGIDKLSITFSGGTSRIFALNPAPQPFGFTIGEALPFGGDAFSDIIYTHVNGPNGPITKVVIDVNDDGKFDANDTVVELTGTINLTAADFTAATFATLRGTPGNDSIVGTTGADTIYGVAGNDTILGSAGSDSLFGQSGDDVLDGGSDSDYLYGGDGADSLIGGTANDTLYGDAGNDTLDGGENDDYLFGGDGDDLLRGGFGSDNLSGGIGADTLEGGADNDSLAGGADNDVLMGQDGTDSLSGDAGDDVLFGGALSDTLTGGAGNDTIDGGTEVDTAVFSNNIGEYEIVSLNGGIQVKHLKAGGDGTDFLVNVERLQFADKTTTGAFLTVSDAVVFEGDNGTSKLVYTVSLIGGATSPVTVNYATSNGTATAGTDYAPGTGSLTFAVGETTKTVEVIVNSDLLNEIDETVNLTLSNASANVTIADAVGVGTILNDDVRVSIANAQVAEGNSGTKTLTFTVSLDKPAVGPVQVSYETSNGTATAGQDYDAGSGFIQFTAGQQTKTISVTVRGDTFAELDESFTVKLLSATGAVIGNGVATGTILNDDQNNAPIAGNDSFSTDYQTALVTTPAQLLANDVDPDGGTLTLTGVQNGTGGTVSIQDGNVVFTPNAGFSGQASYTYTISDGVGGTGTGTVTVTVGGAPPPPNRAPVAAADSYTVNEDSTLTVLAGNGLLANDTDPDNNPLTAQLVTGPANGTISINPDGAFVYTPKANFNGTDTFTYRANDGSLNSDPVTVTINVAPVNDAPVAKADSYTVAEDGTLTVSAATGVLANDTDVDGDALSAALVNGPAHGTVTLNANGSFVYTPTANYNGTDTFTYKANDGSANSAPVTVTINVTPVNDAPVAKADSYTVNEDGTLTVNAANGVLANDTDIDSTNLASNLVTGPAHGTLTLNANGSFVYTPSADFNGTDSFVYQANDGSLSSAPTTVTINVHPVNDAPVAKADSYTVAEDGTLTVTAQNGVLVNDTDVDGNALSAALVTGPAHGTLTLNANGSFNYAPTANFNGTDSFTYKASDGSANSAPVTVTINVTPVNDAPVANDDSGFVVPFNGKFVKFFYADLLANDFDVDGDALSANFMKTTHGSINPQSDGFLFTPDEGYSGPVTITYQVSDGKGGFATAKMFLTVAGPTNTPPVGTEDGYDVAEDGSLHVAGPGVLANDTDGQGDPLSAILVSGPQHGTFGLNSNGGFDYTPDANFNGIDSFTYMASDGKANSQPVTVTINVTPVNDAPVTVADTYFLEEDTSVSRPASGILANDTDVDGDPLTAQLIEGPSHGTLTLNADGSFDYSPDSNFNGVDSFTYRSFDGTAYGDPQTVTFQVSSVNDAPEAHDDRGFETAKDSRIQIDVSELLGNDVDVDGDALFVVSVEDAQNGVAQLVGNTIYFTPAAGYTGTAAFSYTVSDGHGGTSSATASISVTDAPPPGNEPPQGVADTYEVNEDGILNVSAANGLLVNDQDAEGDPLIAILGDLPQHGKVIVWEDGSFRYVPNANFSGTDTFTYAPSDGTQNGELTTVTVNVKPVNDAPVAQADAFILNEDTKLVVGASSGVLANDTDVDSSTLSALLVQGPANGTLSLNADGSFTYTPKADFFGTDSFTYKASDGSAQSSVQTVTLTVKPVNDAPHAVNDGVFQTAYQTGLTTSAATLLANDTDADGDTLSIVSVQNAVNGSIYFQNGNITFNPKAGYTGAASYTYTVSDGHGGTSTATVQIQVNAPGGSDGLKSYVSGFAGNDDLSAVATDLDGTHINGAAGNDILRGGQYDDLLVGGLGDDNMSGGLGADQFRFFGDQIEGGSDTDRILDLNFDAGDVLVFGNFAANTFFKSGGVNAYSNGTAANLDSWTDIVSAAASSNRVTATHSSTSPDDLLLQVTNASGQVENIVISNGWSHYLTAGGIDGL